MSSSLGVREGPAFRSCDFDDGVGKTIEAAGVDVLKEDVRRRSQRLRVESGIVSRCLDLEEAKEFLAGAEVLKADGNPLVYTPQEIRRCQQVVTDIVFFWITVE